MWERAVRAGGPTRPSQVAPTSTKAPKATTLRTIPWSCWPTCRSCTDTFCAERERSALTSSSYWSKPLETARRSGGESAGALGLARKAVRWSWGANSARLRREDRSLSMAAGGVERGSRGEQKDLARALAQRRRRR